jgi:SAM-dependent methyltransferase
VADFDEQVALGVTTPFSGWDFSWLARHSRTRRAPWDYRARVAARAATADTMLDMGTGGGEVLSSLRTLAPRTVATEAWPPNVGVARRRLLRLGIPVVQDEGALDNTAQSGAAEHGRLPFRDDTFDVICNRHESFLAAEVSRVLRPGGTFITQQIDYHSNDELAGMLDIEVPPGPDTWLPLAEQQAAESGLTVTQSARGDFRIEFHDIAGIVYYLRVVNWAVPGYSLDEYRERLRALFDDDSAWPFVVRQRQFLLIASKPG